MDQQINLYQDVLIEKPAPFQLQAALIALFLVVVSLSGGGGYSYWQTSRIAGELAAEQQLKQDKQAYVAELELKFPERKPNPLLIEKITRLEKQVAGKKDAVAYFANQQVLGNDVILHSLQGLAKARVEGLWLNKVSLADEGRQVTLSGSATSELAVPQFIETVGQAYVFGGAVFDSIVINRSEDAEGLVNFSLSANGGAR